MNTTCNSLQRLPQRRDLQARRAGDELLVSDTTTGMVHFLNSTAAMVWECCDGATTVQGCAARMRAEFAAPDDADVEADVRELVSQLAEKGLLNGSSSAQA